MTDPREGVAPAAEAGATRADTATTDAAGPPAKGGSRLGAPAWLAWVFLLPALVLLAAWVLYPIIFTFYRSLFDGPGTSFVGLDNYSEMFTSRDTLLAVRNTVIWVVVAPSVITILGLIFAVLTERIRWATVFKVIVFMPMAISFLASGVIFRLVYENDAQRGVANAIVVGVHDLFADSSKFPGARPSDAGPLAEEEAAGGQGGGDGGNGDENEAVSYATEQAYQPGKTVMLPLLGVKPENIPPDAQVAKAATAQQGALTGTVWFDFTRGGGGAKGKTDPTERGLPGIEVEALQNGKVVATTTSAADGTFEFSGLEATGQYTLRLPATNFAQPFRGLNWLGGAGGGEGGGEGGAGLSLITPAIIGAFIWVWAGFAMVLLAAGLAAIPRDALEAARVDGATEMQTFRRVTVPLLSPVLIVVFVTLVITVLKVFDLVFIIAPDDAKDDANVLALAFWLESFGGGNNQGLGSALAVLLVILVLPAMIFNVRRFRREQS
jgi:alpha-glucoside transport system permease protein